MKRDLIFFDLDDTLYPASNGMWQAMRQRIGAYMHEKLGIPQEDIPRLREQLFRQYGTTLRGLQHHYAIDAQDYLAYVHDLPLEDYLQPNPALRAMLSALPLERWILTNADAAHAHRVLRVLGVEDLFQGVVDTLSMHPYCKPQAEGFQAALRRVARPAAACILVDDLPTTTRAARALGFYTILVRPQPPTDPAAADAVVHDVLEVGARVQPLLAAD